MHGRSWPRATRRDAQRWARTVHRTLSFDRYGSAVAVQFSERTLRELSRRPDVEYVECDGRMYAITVDASADTHQGNSGGADRVETEKAHGTSTGSGAKIEACGYGLVDADGAVLDSVSSDVTGGSASGTHESRTQTSAASARVTVTDGPANSTGASRSV